MGYAAAGYPLSDLARWEPDLPHLLEPIAEDADHGDGGHDR
jgi:hypothetical protein